MLYLLAAWKVVSSPIGRVFGVVIAFLIALGVADMRGAARVRAEWNVANIAAAEHAKEADARAARDAAELEAKLRAEMDAADKTNEEARNGYLAEINKLKGACGPASAATVKRLRNIR